MEMIRVENTGLLTGKPSLDLRKGAQGTHAVFTGIVPVSHEMTIRTTLAVTAQHRRAAYAETMRGFANMPGQTMHPIVGPVTQ